MVKTRSTRSGVVATEVQEMQEVQEQNQGQEIAKKSKAGKKYREKIVEKLESEGEDDAPDVVKSSHESIQMLKSLHESMIDNSSSKKSKKKKSSSLAREERKRGRELIIDEDEELDIDILNVLDEDVANLIEDENKSVQKKKKRQIVINGDNSSSDLVIDKFARKTKKLGEIDVAIIPAAHQNSISEYGTSDKVCEFLSSVGSGKPRVSLAVFSGLRRARPAKKFIVGSK